MTADWIAWVDVRSAEEGREYALPYYRRAVDIAQLDEPTMVVDMLNAAAREGAMDEDYGSRLFLGVAADGRKYSFGWIVDGRHGAFAVWGWPPGAMEGT